MRGFILIFLSLIYLTPADGLAVPHNLVKDTFRHSPNMLVTYVLGSDAIPVERFPGYALKHDLAQFAIAVRQERVYKNLSPMDLPDGSYNFVILENEDLIFGRDVSGAQIGVKHFQLAQGDLVLAAGEYRDGRFNLYSPSYVGTQKMMDPEFEVQLAARAQAFFRYFSPEITFTNDRLLPTPKTHEIHSLEIYCREAEFYRLHADSICQEVKYRCATAIAAGI